MFFSTIIFSIKNEYNQLRHALNSYSVKLLHNVRGIDELEILLNKTGKETEEKYKKLARFDLAIRFQIKPVCIFTSLYGYIF